MDAFNNKGRSRWERPLWLKHLSQVRLSVSGDQIGFSLLDRPGGDNRVQANQAFYRLLAQDMGSGKYSES